jgi:folate-dependent phosphoribosylglycinamide formyltransferase PurN
VIGVLVSGEGTNLQALLDAGGVGIKTTGDARDTVERVNANAERARRNTPGGGSNKNSG